MDSLQLNLFILWKYKGSGEERKGKAYGQASTFSWAPSWLSRDTRIIYTRIQTLTLTENLYSTTRLSIDLNADFTSLLPSPNTYKKKKKNQPFTHVPRNGPALWEERAKDREQPFRHCTAGGKGLRQGKLTMKQVVKQWRKRARMNGSLSPSPRCGHTRACAPKVCPYLMSTCSRLREKFHLTRLIRIVRETITTNTGNIWNWLFWLHSVNEILQRPRTSLGWIST